MKHFILISLFVLSASGFADGWCSSTDPMDGYNCSFWTDQNACEFQGQGHCEWDIPDDEGSCVNNGSGGMDSNCSFWTTQASCEFQGGGNCSWE